MREYPCTLSYLGSVRLPISRIGIGTWAIGGGWGPQSDDDSLQALHQVLDVGCQLFDTAPLYGNGHAEEVLAQVVKERGKRATIITKIYPLNYQWAPAAGTPIDSIFPVEHICLSHPAITAAIPGVQNAEQVKCNLAVIEQGPLPQELLDQITALWQEEFYRDVRTSVGEEEEGERRRANGPAQ